MKLAATTVLAGVIALFACGAPTPAADRAAARADDRRAIDQIDTVVVIYAENRAFDTLYGLYPGANGIPGINPSGVGRIAPQVDVDGAVLPVLPPAWGGLTAAGQMLTVTQAQSAGMPNRPFQIDGANAIDGNGVAVPLEVTTRDLVHRYYSNIMQIDGGRNDRFATYSDAGGLAMGYYDGSRMDLWRLARQYTLADNFYMGAFGGSFLNHQYLICACAPQYPDADRSPAKGQVAHIDVDAAGRFVRMTPAADAPRSRHRRTTSSTAR